MNKSRKAELILISVTLLWSATFLFMKNAFLCCDPITFVEIRFAIAFVLALAFWYKSLKTLNPTSVKDGLILGLTYSVGFYLQSWGLDHTTISKSAFITGTVVVFVPFAHWLIHRERIKLMHIVSVIVTMIGLWVFTEPERGELTIGDITTLCSSMIWAYYVAYLDWASNKTEQTNEYFHQLVILQFAVTILIGGMVQLVWFSGGMYAPHLTLSEDVIVGLLYSGIAASLVATYLQTTYQRFVTPVKAGLLFVLEPVFAALLAWMFKNEMLSLRELCGGVIMLSAIFITDIVVLVKTKTS
ncbi:MAG: DMT family transporter [Candidatus Kapabacteria bacterium]|nr:DMT family transporter [Candidatus Kapabacteria bacterium]